MKLTSKRNVFGCSILIETVQQHPKIPIRQYR
jgi:hypothetical protein